MISFKEENMTNLMDCPEGLFYLISEDKEKILCVKTKYFNQTHGIDAYIVASGEYLSCDGRTSSQKGCETIHVIPLVYQENQSLLKQLKQFFLKKRP